MRSYASMLALALVGCRDAKAAKQIQANASICVAPAADTPGQWATCVHRWAYRLAASQDSATDVARAVVAGCGEPIAYQVNQAPANERIELYKNISKAAPEIALFHVMQARAGHCAIP